jgi:hypothetical protein
MVLEDLNPQLFNALGSAVDSLESAQHEEHVAQAALSGRRYFERLADVLFPAREESYRGRKVGASEYRNRLWAFVADNVIDLTELTALGTEVDRLVEEFNAGLHADRDKERILRALADSAKLTATLLALNPIATRNPYIAHQGRIMKFFEELVSQETPSGDNGP